MQRFVSVLLLLSTPFFANSQTTPITSLTLNNTTKNTSVSLEESTIESKTENNKLSSEEVETITVTANKRKQSLQQIPITVNALTAENIIDLGIINMDNILTQFANLSANSTTELVTGFTIRGIGTNNPHGNVNQAVGIYRDEISYGNPFSGILGVYDTERIEVLRGPQNSLFGRNTTGGAVHFMSARPSLGDDHNTGYVIATAGRFNQFDLTGALNIPLNDTMALRFSGQSIQRDGIYTNLAADKDGNQLGPRTLGDKDRQSARIQYLWQASEQTEVLVNYHYAINDGTNIGNRAFGTRDVNDYSLIINGAHDRLVETIPNPEPDDRASISPLVFSIDPNDTAIINTVDRNGDNPATGNWHKLYNVSSARSYAQINGGFLKVNHHFDSGHQLQLTSSFDHTEIETADETSGSNSLQFIPNRDIKYAQHSHELRIVSPDDSHLRWLAGIYYFKENMELHTIVRRFNYAGPNGNLPRDVAAFNFLDQEDQDLSIYGQLDWDLSKKLTLSTGLRYTDNDKEAVSNFGVAAGYNSDPTVAGNQEFSTFDHLVFDRVQPDEYLGKTFVNNCYDENYTHCDVKNKKEYLLEQNLSEWAGKISLDYRPNNKNLYYLSYARGFKSGGFDTRALAAFFGKGEGAKQAFLPEYLNAYEFGLKSNLTPTLQINSALFYNKWQNLQTFGVFKGEPRYINVPQSTAQGFESEIKWLPHESWYTQLGIGLLDTEITDNGDLIGADEGHELSNSPAVTVNALLRKQFPITSGLITLQSDARYVSEQIDALSYSRDIFSTKDSQFWLNARANYQFGKELEYYVSLWADNLTEETYCSDIGFQNPITPTTTEADIGSTGIDITSTISCQPSATSGERFYGISFGVNFY